MRTFLFCAVMFLAFPAAGQNLIDDPSFENGSVPGCTLGVLPNTWIAVLGTPDTFSEDCGLLPGAPLDFPPGHFVSLGGAYDGIRFVAAGNLADGFGQRLATPLTAATAYEMRVRVARSAVTSGFAYVDVYLSSLAAFNGATLLGTFTVNPSIGAWTEGVATFCAPDDAAARPYLLVRPRPGASTAYLALDAFELVTASSECPPAIIPGLGGAFLVLLMLLLIVLGTTARRKRETTSAPA